MFRPLKRPSSGCTFSEKELYNMQCIFCLMTRSHSSYNIRYDERDLAIIQKIHCILYNSFSLNVQPEDGLFRGRNMYCQLFYHHQLYTKYSCVLTSKCLLYILWQDSKVTKVKNLQTPHRRQTARRHTGLYFSIYSNLTQCQLKVNLIGF